MKTIIKDTNEVIYTDPLHVFEAFMDITERIGTGLFENIVYRDDDGVIEYDVPEIGKHIVKVFDTDQATPDLAMDVMQWVFSMIDSIVNLD